MSEDTRATYRIVFWGEIAPDLSRREVALRLARRFRLRSARQLKYLFSGRLVTLKRSLGEAEARRFSELLTALGMVCRLEREAGMPWQEHEAAEPPVRHTASIRFDLQGFSADDFCESGSPGAVAADPFAARDLPETHYPPVKYYDGRPVR